MPKHRAKHFFLLIKPTNNHPRNSCRDKDCSGFCTVSKDSSFSMTGVRPERLTGRRIEGFGPQGIRGTRLAFTGLSSPRAPKLLWECAHLNENYAIVNILENHNGIRLEMLFPELCDNSCLRWGPLHNAFILGTSLHKANLKEINFSCGTYTIARTFFSLTRTCCCCCCHPQHCKSPAFCSALVCCCMNFLLVFLLACSVRSHFYFVEHTASWHFMTLLIKSHDGPGSLPEIRASALVARS